VLRVSGDELLARLALPHALDPFEGEPLVVVVDGGSGAAPVDPDRLAGVPAVVVATAAIAGLDAQVDVVAPDDAAVERVAAVVAAHPDAAVALAVLLRGTAQRSIAEGLVAESAAYSLLQGGSDHRGWLAGRSWPEPVVAAAAPVRTWRDGDTLHVVLDRPEVRNAYSAAVRDALVEALGVAATDPDLRVELSGAGPSFCSGGDLAEFGTGPDPAAAHVVRLRRSAGRAIAEVAPRVTARLHGACVGAGIELPAFAGRVVAAPDTRCWLPEVSMGLVPGAGGTVSIPRRIGRHRTALLALTGDPVDASTALAWGLVDEIDG